jgi:hypothetical protein
MRFLCALCVLCGLQVSAFSLDREAFTFTKYNLDVRIEPEQQRLAVRGTITLRNDSASPQKNLSLQISSSLAWRSITMGGKPVQFVSQPYASDIDHTGALSEAIVSLPQVASKSMVELGIGYEGMISVDTARLIRIGVPGETAKHTDWDQIGESFSAVRGIGYVAWYPVATEAASLSDGNSVFETLGRWKARQAESSMKVSFCQISETGQVLLVVADGVEAGASAAGGGVGTEGGYSKRFPSTVCSNYNFEPLGRTVPTFALANFSTLERDAIRIEYRATSKSAAADYALAAEKVVPFITDWFGAEHQKAEVVELLDPGAEPFESGSMLLTPLNGFDAKLAEIAAVHQLTHAAFYSPRPWVYEGLAHFAQALYRERQSGRQAALDFMGSHSSSVVETEKTLLNQHASSASAQSLIDTSLEEFYRSKAMCVWWMLRDMVGEPALKKALAAYRADQDKEPSYMQSLIEKQAHRDLEWFFDDWVYRDHGLPDFRVDSIFPRQTTQGNYIVTVTIENLGSAGAEVPVTVRSPVGESTQRLEVHGKSKNSIRIEVSSFPREVVVNDGGVPESDMSNNVFKVPAAPASR